MSNVNVLEAPVIEQQPGTIDMTEFEAQFDQATAMQAVGELALQQEVSTDDAEIQMLVGFNPDLLSMFLRAKPGSELSDNLAKLMVTDLVVNNAEAYGLFEQQERATEDLYHFQQSKKQSNTESFDEEGDDA